MSYCTIEEAWGVHQPVKKSTKGKRKNKKKEKFNDTYQDSVNQKYPNYSLKKRGLHNRLSKNNRFIQKEYEDDDMQLNIQTSKHSKQYIKNNTPSAMNDYDDNYQQLESEYQNNDNYDISSEYNLFSQHNDDLEKINNSEFLPREDVIDHIAPYDDFEDNYHEQGNFKTNYSNFESNSNNSNN